MRNKTLQFKNTRRHMPPQVKNIQISRYTYQVHLVTLLTQICQEFPASISSIQTQFADFLTALESVKVFFLITGIKKSEI